MLKKIFICRCAVALVCFFLLTRSSIAQSKQVRYQNHSWTSLNTSMRIAKHWSIITDVHYRANNFFASPNFYFFRVGGQYHFNQHLSVALGYGHLWLAPSKTGWHTYSNENRIYQQVQYTYKTQRWQWIHRIRNEQRWQQIITNDIATNNYKLTNRIRYLLGANYTIFKQHPKLPTLALANELCLQFGENTALNTYDQNRFFIGAKMPLRKYLSFDIGYMLLYQKKADGLNFDYNNTFRCFFYYTPQWQQKN
ncbi:MAG TPA: hypothetical protein DCQ29_01710 [Chitinophagaceae bacterium]|nr:hypothetical protein [Chitinophagaceae bacterium]